KVLDIAKPLKKAGFHKIHIVKDHNMREGLCLEVERLLSSIIMGNRGYGIELGSVDDYCVHRCVCPIVVVSTKRNSGDVMLNSWYGWLFISTIEATKGREKINHNKGFYFFLLYFFIFTNPYASAFVIN
ncbi:LOW QUALITY PROTEIN: Usp domain-containing protein, partial [Cephalotus follicularis]